jgi:hypothetical protein
MRREPKPVPMKLTTPKTAHGPSPKDQGHSMSLGGKPLKQGS